MTTTDVATVCLTAPAFSRGAPTNTDHCYWCRNDVTPTEAAGSHLWGACLPGPVLAAERARRVAVGQDPSLAAVALRIRANQAVAA